MGISRKFSFNYILNCVIVFLKSYWIEIFLFLLVVSRLIFFVYNYPVSYWDETTNIYVVKSLVKSKQFFNLTYWNQGFFEKPPIWYFITSLLSLTFGSSYIVYRITAFIASVIFSYMLFKIAKAEFSRSFGIISLIVFLSINFIFRPAYSYHSSHTFASADLDSLHLLFLFLSLIFYKKWIDGLFKKVDFLIANLFVALSFLTKGPMAFVAIFLVFLFLLFQGKSFKFLLKWLILSLIVNLVVIIPWYLYMYNLYRDEFLQIHFGYHIVKRLAYSLEGHNESWYFYLKILLDPKEFLFGFLVFPAIVFNLISKRLKKFWVFVPTIGITVILVFLMILQTKLAWYLFYIIPFYPFVITNFLINIKNAFKMFITTF